MKLILKLRIFCAKLDHCLWRSINAESEASSDSDQ